MPTGALFYVDAESLGLPKRIPVPEVAKHSIELREAARDAVSMAIWRCLRQLKALGREYLPPKGVTRPAELTISERRHAAGPSLAYRPRRPSTADLAAQVNAICWYVRKFPLRGGRAGSGTPIVLCRSPFPHGACQRGCRTCSDNFSIAELVNSIPPSSSVGVPFPAPAAGPHGRPKGSSRITEYRAMLDPAVPDILARLPWLTVVTSPPSN